MTREQSRDYDRKAAARGIAGPVLMENAARGTAELLVRLGVAGSVAVVCGKGNNGGDGFAIARLLCQWGIRVCVEMSVDPAELRGDAATAFGPLAALGVPINRLDERALERLQRREWIVDAILGTGAQDAVRPPFSQAIQMVNAANRRVLAVDLPSGLDADFGRPLGLAVRAERTATFVARKAGFDRPESFAYTGLVHVIEIGGGPV
jgi:NAD(P)H-hydrate epimerase